MAFSCCGEIPKFITHTNVALIQKINKVTRFTNLRPISLNSFENKILSKVLHERMIPVLPT